MKIIICLTICLTFAVIRGHGQGIHDAPESMEMDIKDRQIVALANQVADLENELVLRDLEAKRDQEQFKRQVFADLAETKQSIEELKKQQNQPRNESADEEIKSKIEDLNGQISALKSKTDNQTQDVAELKKLVGGVNVTRLQEALSLEIKLEQVILALIRGENQEVEAIKRESAEDRNTTKTLIQDLKRQLADQSKLIESLLSRVDQKPSPKAGEYEEVAAEDEFFGEDVYKAPFGFSESERFEAVSQVMDQVAAGKPNRLVTVGRYNAKAVCSQRVMINADAAIRCVNCLRNLLKSFHAKFPFSDSVGGGRMRRSEMCKMRIERYPFEEYEV